MHHAVLRWLTPSALTVVPELQRRVTVARVRKMAREWNIDYVGVLEAAVMMVEGEEILHVIDGQHRYRAAEEFGAMNGAEVSLPVVVYNNLTRTQVAELFLARNNMASKVGAYDNHMIGLEAGDSLAICIQGAFDNSKFEVGRSANAYTVAAIGNVQKQAGLISRQSDMTHAGEVIEESLAVIAQAWPKEGAERVQGHIIRALMWFHGEHGILNTAGEARLVRVLKAETPKAWRIKAVKSKEDQPFSSGAEYKYLAELWVNAYNGTAGSKLAA